MSLSGAIEAAGWAHVVAFAAIVYAPIRLEWRRHAMSLPKLLRQMANTYLGYTSGTILACGMVSVTCGAELASGGDLARAVCAYIAIFWAVRLVLQWTYDARPHLGTLGLKLSYHALSALFIGFIVIYGWAAIA